MKRERHVFPTDEIAHLWMHQTQKDARNPQGNFYFDGDTIYSYGGHFPIARHVTNVRGEKAVVITTRRYSNTTASHVSAVRRAIPDDVKRFDVVNVRPQSYRVNEVDHEQNMGAFVSEAKEALETAKRSRTYGLNKLDTAFGLLRDAKSYAKFFDLEFPDKDWKFLPEGEALTELRAKLEARRVKEAAAREAELAANRAAWERQRTINAMQEQEKIALWRSGEYTGSLYNVPCMLRFASNGDVETSQGARVPARHALRALRFVQEVKKSGKDWESNGHTFHIGYYAVRKVTGDGTLLVGCHTITWPEIELFAPQLEARIATLPPVATLEA